MLKDKITLSGSTILKKNQEQNRKSIPSNKKHQIKEITVQTPSPLFILL
jgi:hypothetical protein